MPRAGDRQSISEDRNATGGSGFHFPSRGANSPRRKAANRSARATGAEGGVEGGGDNGGRGQGGKGLPAPFRTGNLAAGGRVGSAAEKPFPCGGENNGDGHGRRGEDPGFLRRVHHSQRSPRGDRPGQPSAAKPTPAATGRREREERQEASPGCNRGSNRPSPATGR